MHAVNVNRDHFALFGLPRRYAVDLPALESRYRELQREVHPDRFATAPAAEQRMSMEMATRVNEAYRTLKSPLSRARHLLELRGVDAGIDTDTAMPREFLLQQMGWRETLEEAAQAGDAERLGALEAEVRTEAANAHAALEQALEAGDGDGAGGGEAEGRAAAGLVRRLMFLDKLREEIALAQE
ncbi:MAG: Fe-S protein assembly co-chaperone HscB, partial [Betaproteobacteria bacterium]|nr:Fe-S protein assembly co-chaperone HscB [Betaproteobacteria bacterium]